MRRRRRRISTADAPAFKAQIFELRCRGLSLHAIGRVVNRDHSTVAYHLASLERPPWGAVFVARGAGL